MSVRKRLDFKLQDYEYDDGGPMVRADRLSGRGISLTYRTWVFLYHAQRYGLLTFDRLWRGETGVTIRMAGSGEEIHLPKDTVSGFVRGVCAQAGIPVPFVVNEVVEDDN